MCLSDLTSLITAVGLGSTYDMAGCMFVQATTERKPLKAALVSMWLGAASLFGIEHALRSHLDMIGVIAGYGIGTYVAVRYL